ncbi:MAG: AsmA family protein [Rhodospirillales bacterium]|nr:MAG: AsmA family protein [Rhodospirillales bacterium]
MKILKVLGLVLAGLLVLAIAGVVAALLLIDVNSFKPLIANEVKKATGRDLTIAGDLRLGVSLVPSIVADDVTLSNAEWASRPEMFSVRQLEGRVVLLPLLAGVLEIDRIALIGADIMLEVDSGGRANFDFTSPDGETAAPAPPPEEELSVGAIPLVHEVEIRDSNLAYVNAVTGVRHDTAIDSLIMRSKTWEAPVELFYEGDINDEAIRIRAEVGSLAVLFEQRTPWPVDLSVEAGGAEIAVQGSIADPLTATGLDLAVAVNGDQLGDLSGILGAKVPPFGEYAVSARVAGDVTDTIRASEIAVQLGKSDVKGEVSVALAGTRPVVDAGFSSENLDLAVLSGAVAVPSEEKKAEKTEKSERLFPDDPLQLEALKSVDASFRYDAASVVGRRATLRDMTVAFTLKNGLLDVEQLKAQLYEGTFETTVQFDGRTEQAGVVAKAALRKFDLGRVLAETSAAGMVEGQVNFNLAAEGKGRSIHEIMASLDGKIDLAMGKGRIKSRALQQWVGGPTEVLSNFLTMNLEGYSTVNCALGSFDIKQGVATTGGLLLDTDVAAFVGKGTVNLGTEALDLVIDPEVKRMTLSAAVPVLIRGTFMKPEYSLDRKAAALRVGGLLGGLVYPPALIIGLGELGTFGEGDCVGVKGTAEGQAQPTPAAQPAQPAQPEQTTDQEPENLPGKVLKGTGDSITKGLKKLLGD